MDTYYASQLTSIPLLSAVSVGMPMAGYSSLVSGVLQAATVTAAQDDTRGSVTLAAAASVVDNAYKGMAIRITSGSGVGARGRIVSYAGATKVAMVEWGTGAAGSAGIPSVLDTTSNYELSIDVAGRQKVIVKTEYSNSTCTAALRVCLRDGNGKVVVAAKQTPVNLGISDQATVGFLAEGFEVSTDGMDTAYLIVDTAASGGASPSVSAWAIGV